MTTKEILKELEGFGNEGTKKVLMKHGARIIFWREGTGSQENSKEDKKEP